MDASLDSVLQVKAYLTQRGDVYKRWLHNESILKPAEELVFAVIIGSWVPRARCYAVDTTMLYSFECVLFHTLPPPNAKWHDMNVVN